MSRLIHTVIHNKLSSPYERTRKGHRFLVNKIVLRERTGLQSTIFLCLCRAIVLPINITLTRKYNLFRLRRDQVTFSKMLAALQHISSLKVFSVIFLSKKDLTKEDSDASSNISAAKWTITLKPTRQYREETNCLRNYSGRNPKYWDILGRKVVNDVR